MKAQEGTGRLRVAIVVPQCERLGAVGVVALKQARELAKRHEVILVSDSIPATLPVGVEGVLVRPLRFDFLRRFSHVPNEIAFCLAARRSLERLGSKVGLDAVVCHGHALGALAARPVRKAVGARYCLVSHGDIYFRPPGTYDRRMTAFYRAVTKPAYRAADLVVALAPAMAERAVLGGAAPASVVVIPNGVDPADIGLPPETSPSAPVRRDTRGDDSGSALKVLFVGRLSLEKGTLVLLDAARSLLAQGTAFSLTVIGDGPRRCDFERLLEDPEAARSVRLLGPQDRRLLSRFYKGADVLCVPSLDDALPTVVLEALACGTPVVGSAVGGIPSLVVDGENGVLVSPADGDRLASVLATLASDRVALRRLQARAESSAHEFRSRYSWEHAGRKLCGVIEESCRVPRIEVSE